MIGEAWNAAGLAAKRGGRGRHGTQGGEYRALGNVGEFVNIDVLQGELVFVLRHQHSATVEMKRIAAAQGASPSRTPRGAGASDPFGFREADAAPVPGSKRPALPLVVPAPPAKRRALPTPPESVAPGSTDHETETAPKSPSPSDDPGPFERAISSLLPLARTRNHSRLRLASDVLLLRSQLADRDAAIAALESGAADLRRRQEAREAAFAGLRGTAEGLRRTVGELKEAEGFGRKLARMAGPGIASGGGAGGARAGGLGAGGGTDGS
ncbi:hypothetical protein DFJ74DRAFT_742895 [Hyaloraphidium curvatum]|nr:hypothetical protein DFJ74DRAFT_742895 [Hyaloraphidium curvatum]